MSAYEKVQNNNDFCKKHAARCDKENHRSVCPSKLSKRELEDLYYSLLENNLELKKTINALNEKTRILSTKVQRMTAQTKNYSDKDCCAAGKAVISEQKAAIADLTKANEAMADRLRRLSTQLCTAKQFLKQNPNARHCYKCYVNATTSVKNLSTTSLQNKNSDANLKSLATSAVYLDREPPTTRTAETINSDKDVENDEKGDAEKVCNEDRCRSTMEDFKQKIGELEEELAKTHEEYSSRMTQLENQVSQLQEGAMRARSQQGLRARDDALELARGLRDASAEKTELQTLLSIEQKKVAELEMRLKAAEVSQQVARAIEGHLNAANRLEEKQLKQTSIQRYSVSSNLVAEDESPRPTPALPSVSFSPKRQNELTVPDDKLSKSDDSGYADHRRESYSDDKSVDKTNQDLIKKIGELQAQLDALKLCSAKEGHTDVEQLPCCERSIPYGKKWDDEQDSERPKIIPKRPQISIFEPEARAPKEQVSAQVDMTNELPGYSKNTDVTEDVLYKDRRKAIYKENNATEIPSKYCECHNRVKNQRNDPDLDASSLRSAEPESDNSTQNQAGKTTHRVQDGNECALCLNNFNDANGFKSNSINQTRKSDERFSGSLLQQQVELLNVKPKDITVNNAVDDVSESKSNRVSQVIFQSGSDNRDSQEIKPKTPLSNIPEDSNNRNPAIIQTPKPSTRKAVDHNFQQIPGPLPMHNDSTSSKRSVLKNKIITANWKKARNYGKRKTNDTGEKDNKIVEVEKTMAVTRDKYFDGNVKNNQYEIKSYGKHDYTNGNQDLKYDDDKDVTNDGKSKGMAIEIQLSEGKKTENQETFNDSFMHSIQEKPQGNMEKFTTPSGVQTNTKNGEKEPKDRLETKTLQLDESTKPGSKSVKQDISRIDEFGSVLRDAPIGTSTPKPENRVDPLSPHTYTVDSDGKQSRATSPDNTDNEISVMTDLPTEKDVISPREALSPGEHEITTTSTGSSSLPNELTLSEGEVPAGKYPERKISKSVGEASSTDYPKKDNSLGEYRSSSEKMEAALQAISQELARCRWLLQSQRTREQWESRDVATGFDCACDSLILRRTKGLSRIDGTVAPTCLFIVHIATVVLADEAVVRSREARFMLTWRFFDSDSTVTPTGVGRVLNFHFSTQYHVEMTKEVVNYLRNDNMLIMICDLDYTDKPFAMCTLPLRQVLINANKRVDMSLPLRAGPFLRENTSDTFNTSDDIGVLDAWCMLHCDPTQLPVTNRAIVENNGEPKNASNNEQPKERAKASKEYQQKQGNESFNLSAKKQEYTVLDGKSGHSQQPFHHRPFTPPTDSIPRTTNISFEGKYQVGFKDQTPDRIDTLTELSGYGKNTNLMKTSTAHPIEFDIPPSRGTKSQISSLPICEDQVLEITVLWLTLNENCETMLSNDARRLYVAYTFLGRDGAELETPISMPKPKHATDKCIFNFRKCFNLTEMDMRILEHMANCRSQGRSGHSSKNCIVFTVVSEPPEDPFGLDNCEDIGFAFLYLGDLLAYSSGDSFTEVLPVRAARAPGVVCGVLAVQVDGLYVLRALKDQTS